MTTVDDNMVPRGTGFQPVPTQLEKLCHEEASVSVIHAQPVKLRIDLGRAWLAAEDVSRLCPGSVVELTCQSDSDVGVWAGGHLTAQGELVMVEGRLGVRVARLEK